MLRQQGVAIGSYRIRKLMTLNGLGTVWKRKFIHTTDSRYNLPIAENFLQRQFEPDGINLVWVVDITYIRTRRG